MSGANRTTSVRLLARLAGRGQVDEDAWLTFVDRYGLQIFRWCLGLGLRAADAQDVTQQVFLRLSQRMRTFAYRPGGSFRAWLKTVTRNALRDYLEDQGRQPAAGIAEPAWERLQAQAAWDDFASRIDREYTNDLFDRAMSEVRCRVPSHHWEAFWRTAVLGEPAAAVARSLHLSVSAVYKARTGIVSQLRNECRALEAMDDGGHE